jgi:hypothetical protein
LTQLGTLAERILVRPPRPRECLVDDGNPRRILDVKFGEQTAPQQGNSQQVKTLRRHARSLDLMGQVGARAASFAVSF